jgi:tRNA(Arg) A34 adenosine deaminase TadA
MTNDGPRYTEILLRLPGWLMDMAQREERAFASVEARMQLAIGLARQNIEQHTGGPFGAAVFAADSGRLVSVGVNLVEASNCSIAHAEMVALALAQQAVGHYDLGTAGVYELVTSTEPCAMCLGAIPWSGAHRIVCGARGEDATAIGFDEGAKPPDWVGELNRRGIEVVRDVLRDEARTVLQQYAQSGGLIYNPGQGS